MPREGNIIRPLELALLTWSLQTNPSADSEGIQPYSVCGRVGTDRAIRVGARITHAGRECEVIRVIGTWSGGWLCHLWIEGRVERHVLIKAK